MSSAFDIQGRNCIFQMKIDDVYLDVLCAKTFSLNRVYELKETTTVQSGFDKEFRPRKKSYTISFNAVTQVEADAGKPTIKTLFNYAEGFLPIPYRIIYEYNSANVMVIQGSVYVNSAVFNANPINLLDGTTEMTGNGPIEVLDALPVPVNINITSIGDPAIAALIQFKLYNSNGDIVFDSARLPGASGGNFAHPVSVTGQVQSGTYSFFWQVDSNSVGNTFDLDAPPTKHTTFEDNIQNENSFGVQAYNFTADRNVVFAFGVISPPPTCVPVFFTTGMNNTSGTEGTFFVSNIVAAGSEPFNITAVTKPAWMTITILPGGILVLSGMPLAGTGQVVDFDINNACGTDHFAGTVDIAAAPATCNVDWTYAETDDTPETQSCTFKVYINAVLFLSQPTSDTGSFTVVPGDVVEVRIVGNSIVTKTLTVDDDISGNLYNDSSAIAVQTFSFTAVSGHNYTVDAQATNF